MEQIFFMSCGLILLGTLQVIGLLALIAIVGNLAQEITTALDEVKKEKAGRRQVTFKLSADMSQAAKSTEQLLEKLNRAAEQAKQQRDGDGPDEERIGEQREAAKGAILTALDGGQWPAPPTDPDPTQ